MSMVLILARDLQTYTPCPICHELNKRVEIIVIPYISPTFMVVVFRFSAYATAAVVKLYSCCHVYVCRAKLICCDFSQQAMIHRIRLIGCGKRLLCDFVSRSPSDVVYEGTVDCCFTCCVKESSVLSDAPHPERLSSGKTLSTLRRWSYNLFSFVMCKELDCKFGLQLEEKYC